MQGVRAQHADGRRDGRTRRTKDSESCAERTGLRPVGSRRVKDCTKAVGRRKPPPRGFISPLVKRRDLPYGYQMQM